jgi:hypothetical protein
MGSRCKKTAKIWFYSKPGTELEFLKRQGGYLLGA